MIDLSCPDWADRLRDRRPLVPNLALDAWNGERAVRIFDKLKLFDVEGTPPMADAAGDWFRDIVRALFGSLDPVTKARAIRELMLLVPKKNSKTTNGALLMLTALLMNDRPNATLIMTAPVIDVADLAFSAAAGAIDLDPTLKKLFHVRDHLKTIVHRQTKAELQIMTFDPATLTGQKPVAVLIDELHVVASMPKAAKAIRQLRGGMLPFPEAFLAFITTQSEDPPSGVFKAELTKARAIRDGTQQGVMLPVLYEFPIEMQKDPAQWKDPANWYMVTPNEGRSIAIPRLAEDMHTAEQTSNEELIAWASQHLNVQIGIALKSDGWSGADFWESNEVERVTLEDLIARSEVITAGVDGGGLDDLLALSFVGREATGTGPASDTGGRAKKWLHWVHAWAHPSVLERHKQEAPKLLDFAAAGELTLVKRMGDDIAELVVYVEQVEATELLDNIGVDQAGIGQIVDAIVGAGIAFERIVGIPQGWKLVGAIKTLERKLAEGTFEHGGQALMGYAVSNAKAEPRGNAIIITKQGAGNAKIDPLMATFDAVALMSMNPQPKRAAFQLFFAGGGKPQAAAR